MERPGWNPNVRNYNFLPESMPLFPAELITVGSLLLLPHPLGLAMVDLLTPTQTRELPPRFFTALASLSQSCVHIMHGLISSVSQQS